MSAPNAVLGRTEPRIWTPPLRPLVPAVRDAHGAIVVPATSMGFEHIEFARDTLRHPLDPWQEFAAIHAGELLLDGRPRFRIVLILVARQNGKTELLVVLALHWQFVDGFPLILGTSTKLDYAKESWTKSRKLAEKVPDFAELRGLRKWYRESNGEQESWTTEDSRYKIAPANEEGGRSLTINRLICDELRQHHDYSAWSAAEEATSAVWDGQVWALSNMGDVRSVVLNDHRQEALDFIKWWDEFGNEGVAELLLAGEPVPDMVGDHRLGIFEWSAPEGADPEDIHALAQANPNLNRRKDGSVLLAKARRAKRTGGEALTAFQTESMCLNVPRLDPAIDLDKWAATLVPGTLDEARSRIALCFDVSLDQKHATLAAAGALAGGRIRGELIAAWSGYDCLDQLRRALPDWLRKIKPRSVGWLPNGPAAAFAADMKKRPGWPPNGVTVEEIRTEVPAVCMGFAEQIDAGRFLRSEDELLDTHVRAVEWRTSRLGGRVFSRTGGHCDAAYAMAGAVHLARTLPPAPLPSKIY